MSEAAAEAASKSPRQQQKQAGTEMRAGHWGVLYIYIYIYTYIYIDTYIYI